MFFTDDFLSFIKSNDIIKEIDVNSEDPENVQDGKYYMQKYPVSDNLFVLVKNYHSNNFAHCDSSAVCVVNKDGELIKVMNPYFLSHYCRSIIAADDTYEYKKYLHCEKYNDFNKQVQNKAIEIFNSITEQTIKNTTISLSDRNDALELMLHDNKEPKFSFYYNLENNLDNIIRIDKEPDAFFKESVSEAIDVNMDGFIRFCNIKKAYDQILEENKDERGKVKYKIFEIFQNKKYKNLRILYTNPDGTELTYFCNTDYINDRLPSIFLTNTIENLVPILAIKKIIWSRSTLYDASEYDLNYTEEELENAFIKAKNIGHLRKESYENKETLLKLFDIDNNIVYSNIDKFKNDKDFYKKILERARYKDVALSYAGEDILSDMDIIATTLAPSSHYTLMHSEIIQTSILKKLPKYVFKDKQWLETLLMTDYFDFPNLIAEMDIADIESDTFINVIKENDIDVTLSESVIQKIPYNTLIKLANEDEIVKNFKFLNYVELTNEEILNYVTNTKFDERLIYEPFNTKPALMTLFQDDHATLCELVKGIKSTYGVKEFLKKCDITTDYEIMNFCSFNPMFLKELDPKNMQFFLEAETENFKNNIALDDNGCIAIDSDYCHYVIDENGLGIHLEITHKGIERPVYTINDKELIKIIFDGMCEKIHETYNIDTLNIETFDQLSELMVKIEEKNVKGLDEER